MYLILWFPTYPFPSSQSVLNLLTFFPLVYLKWETIRASYINGLWSKTSNQLKVLKRLEDQILFFMVKDYSSCCNGLWGGPSSVIRILLPSRSNLLLNIFPGSKYLLPWKNVQFVTLETQYKTSSHMYRILMGATINLACQDMRQFWVFDTFLHVT